MESAGTGAGFKSQKSEISGNYQDVLNSQRESFNKFNPKVTKRARTTQSTPFEQNGVFDDLITSDFTVQTALGSWTFKDAVHATGGRARSHFHGKGLEWNAQELAVHIEPDNEGSPRDSSQILSPKFTNVKNGWNRKYCMNLDLSILSSSTKLTIFNNWFKITEKWHAGEKIAEIYSTEECESEDPTFPYKDEERKICVPGSSSGEESTVVELGPFKPLAVNLVLKMVLDAESDIIIKSIAFRDCSPEPDMSQKPTPKPSGWLANAKAINDPRYGTYWKPEEQKEEEEIEEVQENAPAWTPPPVVILNAPTQPATPETIVEATEQAATEQAATEANPVPGEIKLKGANVRISSTTTTTTTTTTYKKAEAVDLPADWGVKKEEEPFDSFVKYLGAEEEEIEELVEEEEEIIKKVNFKKKPKTQTKAEESSSSLGMTISTLLSSLLMLLLI
ncbi:Oidioi.mRNA.OKI2018_I69.XSR.g16765.t1.cds [Oikopleura dioica]|uniref:Oidioi.mRNA.OKI2018_I69.XSR.g16765.t1.cds n=1 Tax=Oikopleura dioica TaxID=34765 RepID=A0ABN7SMB0_OIKDI|nr:Oidioi.mRNA.OKI2018_I69.XSR.g16765.t1.cds [Oikopleura dioica]